jgi:hypothetical protein
MPKFILTLLIACSLVIGHAQSSDEDALFIKKIFDHALTKGNSHSYLRHLCKEVGHRLSGTDSYDKSAEYCKKQLMDLNTDTAYFQPCTVNTWTRGDDEIVELIFEDGSRLKLDALALGFSVGTGEEGITGEVIEVNGIEQVKQLGEEAIKGKIVFYNRPMDPTATNTFNAYGGAVDQRVYGATTAAEFGAIASLTRSMTMNLDDQPHTGTLYYREEYDKIPGLGISTMDAEVLSERLIKGPVKAFIKNSSFQGPKRDANTVIGEIRGSEFPDEIILIGGHLDSWDVGEGAHDDGTGVAQSLQVIQALRDLNYQPKRTIRCVLFANEESGLAGGREYAEESNENEEFHLAAIESDRGGFIPKGFSFEGHPESFSAHYQAVSKWSDLFEAYGILFSNGGSGADIGPLKNQKGLLVGLKPDSQRYFDFHHTRADVFEMVNKRELEMGAAAMTALVYLIDKYGLQKI